MLRGTAGLSREDIAATSFAVAEEQKSEIRKVHTGRTMVWIGAVLLLLAFPAVCFTYAQADIKGAPLLTDAGGTVANTALSIEDSAVFAADQFLDAVLLDIPRVFDWHLTSLRPGRNHGWLRPFVLLYHILDKFIVLATFFAAWRGGHLRSFILQAAGLDAVPALASLRAAPAVVAALPCGGGSLQPEPVHTPVAYEEPQTLGATILDVPIFTDPLCCAGETAEEPTHRHEPESVETVNPEPVPEAQTESQSEIQTEVEARKSTPMSIMARKIPSR